MASAPARSARHGAVRLSVGSKLFHLGSPCRINKPAWAAIHSANPLRCRLRFGHGLRVPAQVRQKGNRPVLLWIV